MRATTNCPNPYTNPPPTVKTEPLRWCGCLLDPTVKLQLVRLQGSRSKIPVTCRQCKHPLARLCRCLIGDSP